MVIACVLVCDFQVLEVTAGNRGKSGLHRTMVLANGQEQQCYGKCSREQTACGQG